MYFCLREFCVCLCFVIHYLCVHSSLAIILKRKRKLVALLLSSYRCTVTLNVLWRFLTVPWVGLQCVIVVYLDHTNLLFYGQQWRGREFQTLAMAHTLTDYSLS